MTIAEATNNGFGLTGLAYGVKIMLLRVLDSEGAGDAVAISRAIRYAADHGAKVINMSLEFDTSVTASQIPEIVSAGALTPTPRGRCWWQRPATRRTPPWHIPPHTMHVISVGATTLDGCQADYSNGGPGLKLMAPGGGSDAPNADNAADIANCHPGDEPPIFQETFARDGSVRTSPCAAPSTRARRWPARTWRPPRRS